MLPAVGCLLLSWSLVLGVPFLSHDGFLAVQLVLELGQAPDEVDLLAVDGGGVALLLLLHLARASQPPGFVQQRVLLNAHALGGLAVIEVPEIAGQLDLLLCVAHVAALDSSTSLDCLYLAQLTVSSVQI